jgi:hypothetical protein
MRYWKRNFQNSAILAKMSNSAEFKTITSRVIRPGDKFEDESYWDRATPAERIDSVWELTLLCLAWQPNRTDEPRLQRSVSRIQRTPR